MNDIFARYNILDIHTHRRDAADAIINIAPGEPMQPGLFYSVGLHPWDTDAVSDADLQCLADAVSSPQVLAVGEAGLDALRGAPPGRQLELLEAQARMAEQAGKPLIMHIVKGVDAMLALRRRLRPVQPWIWHGYRGGPEQARQLLAHGLYLSLGPRYNADTALIIPDDRLMTETDDADVCIAAHREELAALRRSVGL